MYIKKHIIITGVFWSSSKTMFLYKNAKLFSYLIELLGHGILHGDKNNCLLLNKPIQIINVMLGFSRDKKNNPTKRKIITSNVLVELHFIFHSESSQNRKTIVLDM